MGAAGRNLRNVPDEISTEEESEFPDQFRRETLDTPPASDKEQ
jgi:hypothetical protein